MRLACTWVLRVELRDDFAAEIQAAVARISDLPRSVRLGSARLEQVQHLVAAGVEEFGDEPPVAPGPERLRAEEAGRWPA